jgi:hypothetical protein
MYLDINKFYAFTFDPLQAIVLPPFKAVLSDALEVVDFKAILKQKAIIDTITVLVQQIPLDKDGNKPIMIRQEAELFVRAAQSILPKGAVTFTTPMETTKIDFKDSQNFNELISLGEHGLAQSVGINGNVTGTDSSDSTTAMKASLENDYAFVEHLYRQYENFINIRFYNESKKWPFRIKFFGNRYTDDATEKSYLAKVTTANFPIVKLLAYDYDSNEIDGIVEQEDILDYKNKLKPLIAGFNMKSGGAPSSGRPQKDVSELGDKGAETRDSGSNDQEKV